MQKKFLSVALCLMAALTMSAQDVDKAKVTGNAEAAAKAGADLQKLEAAENPWKFDGSLGLNAAATSLVNWAAGGKNNVNGIAYAKLHLLYHKDAIYLYESSRIDQTLNQEHLMPNQQCELLDCSFHLQL